MNTLDKCKEEHREITSTISDLRAMLTPEQLRIKPNAKASHQLLCDLFDKIIGHLHVEDEDVYPDLLVHEDPKIKSMAWGFLSGERSLRSMVGNYHRKWLKDCDFEFGTGFLEDTNEILDLVVDRIDREEKVLFPRLEKSAM